MLFKFELETTMNSLYNITNTITEVIQKNNVISGICVIYTPHTTAAITVNENGDPDVIHDFLLGLSIAIPNRVEFLHLEKNSDAHLKSSIIGSSQTMIIQDATLLLGIWQSVYFCEFDSPRKRHYYVKIIKDSEQIYEDNTINLENSI